MYDCWMFASVDAALSCGVGEGARVCVPAGVVCTANTGAVACLAAVVGVVQRHHDGRGRGDLQLSSAVDPSPYSKSNMATMKISSTP